MVAAVAAVGEEAVVLLLVVVGVVGVQGWGKGEEIVVPETAVAVGLALVAVVAAASACLPRSLGAQLPSRRSES